MASKLRTRRIRGIVAWLFITGQTIAAFQVVAADDAATITAEQKKIAETYLTGMWKMRESLRSGEFIAMETKLRPGFEGQPKRFTKIVGHIRSAFDVGSSSFRFDRQITYTPDAPDQNYPQRFAYNRDYSCFYRGDEESVMMHAPEHVCNDPAIEPWDVRTLGLCNWAEQRAGYSVAKLRDFYSTIGQPTEVSERDGVCQVTWTYGKSMDVRRRITIDRKLGFAATRLEDIAFIKPTGKWEPWSTTDVAWQEQGGDWVPKRVDFIDHRNGITEPREKDHKHFIDLEWTNVNKPVKGDKFSYEGFGLPVGTRVWDNRIEANKLEKVIGE